jgi:hypothetical protein
MSVDLPMGADFKERNLEEGSYLLMVLRHPFPGHEEGSRDLLLDQIVDQRLIVARSLPHRAEIERQRDSRTRGRTRLNYLGLREGRYRCHKQHREGQAEYPWPVARSHGD